MHALHHLATAEAAMTLHGLIDPQAAAAHVLDDDAVHEDATHVRVGRHLTLLSILGYFAISGYLTQQRGRIPPPCCPSPLPRGERSPPSLGVLLEPVVVKVVMCPAR